MASYDDMMEYVRDTQALAQVAGRLGWDQETTMPRAAAPQRAEEMAAMEAVLHARRTDPKLGDWLAVVETDGPVQAANLRLIKREYERASKVPARLASEIARVTSMAQGIWAEAREKDDFSAFAPTLKEVLALKREEGAALAEEGDVYDAMLQDYEPGATAAQLEAMFGAMRPRLVALREQILGKPEPKGISGSFDEGAQMRLSRVLAKAFGYDMARGRVDKAVHPFSSGSGLDVRITTRTSPTDPFNCIYSTIHEVGHACYEQGIHPDYLLTPMGQGVSMGVHESQSRIYENQIGRSRPLTGWLLGQMQDAFGDIGIDDPDLFYAAVNKVQSGYIRTEADEVHYNLHVLLRFDLERQLVSRALEVEDLEAAWNERFEADFGIAVDKPANGVLQDVHWSVGLFGYFPTYSLGNVYAGCLNQKMQKDVPGLEVGLTIGDTSPATMWLHDNVQVHGGLYEPRDLIENACGVPPSEAPLLDYLEEKFGVIYGL